MTFGRIRYCVREQGQRSKARPDVCFTVVWTEQTDWEALEPSAHTVLRVSGVIVAANHTKKTSSSPSNSFMAGKSSGIFFTAGSMLLII